MKPALLYSFQSVGLALLLLLSLTQAALGQRIFYVRTNGTNPDPATATTGWGLAQASPDLGAVLAQARPTDQVWVAGGLYKPSRDFDFGATPTDNRQKTFRILSGVSVYGGFAGTETALSQRVLGSPSSTTLSGDLGGAGNVADNSYHVVTMFNNAQTARLDGLVVTGGNANGSTFEEVSMDTDAICPGNLSEGYNLAYFTPLTTGYGGGVLAWSVVGLFPLSGPVSNSELVNCLLIDNRAELGGGLCTMGLGNGAQNTTITNCRVLNNTARTQGGGLLTLCRAGLTCTRSPQTSTTQLAMTDCLIAGNTAALGAGLTNTTKGISPNLAASGLETITNRVSVTRCVFRDNVTPGTTGGAGVFNQALVRANSNPSFVNCLFATNSGGGFVNLRDETSVSSPLVVNCTFARNTPAQRGFFNIAPATARLRNCLLYADGSGSTVPFSDQASLLSPQTSGPGTASVEYSLIEGRDRVGTNPSGLGMNATTFIDAASDDYRLRLGSRAIDAGDPATTTGTADAVDLAGNPRIRDGRVDIGAYEYTPPRTTPARVYVRQGSPGSGNGSSWANAYPELRQALSNVVAGDEFWVAGGTYKPTATTDRSVSFALKNGVAIYGGFAGTETSLSQRPAVNPVGGQASTSILSGDIGTVGSNADNSYHVLSNSNLNNTAVLDGFVITGGNANGTDFNGSGGGIYNTDNSRPTLTNCSLQTNAASSDGGAIYNDGSSPTLTDCSLQNNTAGNFGGAIYNYDSSPALANCSLQTNTASNDGGAIYNTRSSPGLTNCTLQNNTANYGGAVYNNIASRPTLTNCRLQTNSAVVAGGAIANNNGSSPRLTDCNLQDNTARSGGAIYSDASGLMLTNCNLTGNIARSTGGVIFNIGSSSTLINCRLQNNSATVGGAIANSGSSSPRLTNCSLQGNTATGSGGAIYNTDNSNPTLTNCVGFGNGGSNTFYNISISNSTVTASYSLFDNTVTGYNTGGTGNKTTATTPFVAANSVALAPGSSAINAGNNAAYVTASGPATDLLGNPRIYPTGGLIDMGAVEFQGALPVTLAYFNGRMTAAGAVLGWATAREENNAHFRIERSQNAVGFESIATVPSLAPDGNSVEPLTYSYLDVQPLPGTSYYRLVQTDSDGTRTTSKIIALTREGAGPVLYPNPVGASGEASIEPGIAHTGYQITDVLGRVVQRTDAPGVLDRVSLASLPAGVYLLHVQTADGGVRTWRLLR